MWELPLCGSWLACDADTPVCQIHRVDAIAGKPAPTGDRVWLCCCCCSGPYILFAGEVSGLLICAFDHDLDLRAPRQTRWPQSDSDLGGKPAGRRFSRAGPRMAHRGAPPNHCRIAGMPSHSEAPSVGAKTFWLLLCLYKSDPPSGRNQYQPSPK